MLASQDVRSVVREFNFLFPNFLVISVFGKGKKELFLKPYFWFCHSVLNLSNVSILQVDREERPDVDKVNDTM